MNFLKNKHIINYIRTLLNDKDDIKIRIEEKVDIVNEAIKMYGKYIFNFKKITLNSVDGESYDLPTGTSYIKKVKNTTSDYEYLEGTDFEIDDFYTIKFYGKDLNRTIEVTYDIAFENLDVEQIRNVTSGSNKQIAVSNLNYYKVGDYVMFKDSNLEEVTAVKDITNGKIVVDLVNRYTGGYIIGNSKVADFDILGIYSQYYTVSKNSGGAGNIKSESWSQGGRSKSVSYGTNTSGKGEIGNDSLDLFINRLKNDKNYKFKEFVGIDVLTNFK